MPHNAGSMVVNKVAKSKWKNKSVVNEVLDEPHHIEAIDFSPEDPPLTPSPTERCSSHGLFRRSQDSIRRWFYKPWLAHWYARICILVALCAIILSMSHGAVSPTSFPFIFILLFATSYVVGKITELLHLPALLGMLLTGIVLKSCGLIQFDGVASDSAAMLREIALTIILLRAGLGLDPTALRNLSLMIIRLAVIPSIVEGTFMAVVSHYFLGLPWLWGALLGSILAAVSPAVVIPCLFNLSDRGYGVEKGIPTLVVAAASLDDVIAISAFGAILSVVFSTGNMLLSILKGPLGVIGGIIIGSVWGVLCIFLPHRDGDNVVILRSLMLGLGGISGISTTTYFGAQGAGPLACIVMAFVARTGWDRLGRNESVKSVIEVFQIIWDIFQPILFGAIGAEVDVFVLNSSVVGYGILCLLIALLARIIVSILISFGGNFNWKERIFIAWAWFPKATVQAAIGPVALDIAERNNDLEQIEHARIVLIVAVLAIIITAPIGAILVSVLGPRLLSKNLPKNTLTGTSFGTQDS